MPGRQSLPGHPCREPSFGHRAAGPRARIAPVAPRIVLERRLLIPRLMDIRNYLFGGETRQLAYKALDASSLRGKAIAENLANVQTPGYKRKEVDFEDQLRNALRAKLAAAQDQPGHMPAGKGIDLAKIEPRVYEPEDPTLTGEINNVDVDMEGAKLAENQLYYSFLTKWVGFDKYMAAIAGRSMG